MMELPITNENLIEQLRAMFPELEEAYQAEVKSGQGEKPPSN